MLYKAVKIENNLDKDGNPAGGSAKGVGIDINWQNGPLGRGDDKKEPNGAFVETVLFSVLRRLEFYQESKFECKENAIAVEHVIKAVQILNSRTQSREKREVEGTHEK